MGYWFSIAPERISKKHLGSIKPSYEDPFIEKCLMGFYFPKNASIYIDLSIKKPKTSINNAEIFLIILCVTAFIFYCKTMFVFV